MPQIAIVIPPDGVNVRADAGPDSPVIDRIGQGERVVVRGSKKVGRVLWLRVQIMPCRTAKCIGWVCARYVDIVFVPDAAPEPDPPPEPVPPVPVQPEPTPAPWVPPPDIEPEPEPATEQSHEWLFIVLAAAVAVAIATFAAMEVYALTHDDAITLSRYFLAWL